MDTLHQAAVRADNYSLTHKMAFGKNNPQALDHPEKRPVEGNTSTGVGSSNFAPRDRTSNTNANSSRMPAGPTCFYCKKRGHIMLECQALEKNNKRATGNALVVSSCSQTLDTK